jgi:hypothetical protein
MAAPNLYSDGQAADELRRNPGVLWSSSDPFEATAQTVEYMCRLIRDSLADGVVQRATGDACGAVASPEAVWSWVKSHLRFVHHQKLLVAWLGAPDELQLLIRPDALLKMREPKGDCAVYTCLVCAMLDCCGLPWEIVTVAVDPRQPAIFSHVYPRAILADGRRVVLDASHGQYPGWEVPAEHMSAKQVWDMEGRPIGDDAAPRFTGLHGYLYGGADKRGLGQCDDDTGIACDDGGSGSSTGTGGSTGSVNPIYSSGGVPVTSSGPLPMNCPGDPGCPTSGTPTPGLPQFCASEGWVYNSSTDLCQPPAGSSAGATVGSTLAQDITALLTGGNQIAKTVTGQTTTTINAGTVLLYAGIAAAVLFVISLAGKK